MRNPVQLHYDIICANCKQKCNYSLLNLVFYKSHGSNVWKCTNFSPSIVYDRQTLRNQVFVQEKQIDKYFERKKK